MIHGAGGDSNRDSRSDGHGCVLFRLEQEEAAAGTESSIRRVAIAGAADPASNVDASVASDHASQRMFQIPVITDQYDLVVCV